MPIKEIIDLIKLLLPFIMEIIKLLKGQSTETKQEALLQGKTVIKDFCEGPGCPPRLKK